MADTDVRSLDEALDGLLFAMVTTPSPEGLSARPITLLDHEGGKLRFLVSRSADWVRHLDGDEHVQASFADPKKNTYVSLSGTAELKDDKALIEKLWNPAATPYFEGPDDPDCVALEVDVTSGEWWDGPSGRVGQAIAMATAIITQSPEPSGEKGEIAV